VLNGGSTQLQPRGSAITEIAQQAAESPEICRDRDGVHACPTTVDHHGRPMGFAGRHGCGVRCVVQGVRVVACSEVPSRGFAVNVSSLLEQRDTTAESHACGHTAAIFWAKPESADVQSCFA
jgi:hypothetical protein